jgi:uncharacterized RDD family membrane protein YckC
MRYAGFWRRFAAYWLDILPITAIVVVVYYTLLGFDATLERYRARGPGDVEGHLAFIETRAEIRNLSMALYLLYCGLAEASPLRGTLGKWLMGIQVVNLDGSPLTRVQAILRNSGKPLSFLIIGLGCLWIMWSRRKQGWHDMLADTLVVCRSGKRIAHPPADAD